MIKKQVVYNLFLFYFWLYHHKQDARHWPQAYRFVNLSVIICNFLIELFKRGALNCLMAFQPYYWLLKKILQQRADNWFLRWDLQICQLWDLVINLFCPGDADTAGTAILPSSRYNREFCEKHASLAHCCWTISFLLYFTNIQLTCESCRTLSLA